jgi:choline dehydrogenase
MGTSEGFDGQRYDVIVVGSGSAGAVVARRLVDRGDMRVLLLEAGGTDTDPAIHDVARMHELWDGDNDWAIRTTPQVHAMERQLQWPRGRVLGGSSALNGMIWVRGNPLDYDVWAYAGNDGWRWEDVAPLFAEIEAFMEVRKDVKPDPFHQAVIDAAVEAGIPYNPDYNGESQLGISAMQYVIKDGTRNSTARAYLGAVLDHPNLTILTRSVARRLVFRKDRCVGVEYEREGALETAYADGEVVVSGGTIGSPGLLLASGIGPAGDLRALGIDVVADLPGVGRNLHDHLLMGVIWEAAQPVPPPVNNLAEASMFLRSDPALRVPDLHFMCIHVPFHLPTFTVPEGSWTIGVGLVRPASRGTLRLRSADPSDKPLIDPAYLAEEADVEAMVRGVELAREVAAASAFDDWRGAEALPGESAQGAAALRDFTRRAAGSYFHPVGTCRMGIGPDAVVDPELRVRGIEGLRVADASVMPDIVSANTNTAAMVIGEKAADLVRGARPAAVVPGAAEVGV